MQKIKTFLTYNDQAEAAATLYTSLFADGKIMNITRFPKGTHMPEGSVMSVSFQLAGQTYYALNAGPYFTFSNGMSLYVDCADQAEVDHLWDGLLANGGEESQCGWLVDPYGVHWQLIPEALPRLMNDPDPARSQRVVQAMLQMRKIIVADLEAAWRG